MQVISDPNGSDPQHYFETTSARTNLPGSGFLKRKIMEKTVAGFF
jgi:hypothetical protein